MKNLFVSLLVVVLFAALTFGQNNTASTTQSGSSNEAFVDQLGNTNNAYILSSGSNNNDNLLSTHLFNVPGTSVSNIPLFAKGISQYGDNNVGSIIQSWNNNFAGIYQDGDRNHAYILQNDMTHSTTISPRNAWIDQFSGNDNLANVSQNGQVDESYISQQGSLNTVLTTQNQVALSDVLQIGSGNHLEQAQSLGGLDPDLNIAYAYQIGGNNSAYQSQSGLKNTSLITSIGSNNGTDLDRISTDQLGDGNNASIEEGLLGIVNNSKASILQHGSINSASINQEVGDYNEARVSQNSNLNSSIVDQHGAFNKAFVTQK